MKSLQEFVTEKLKVSKKKYTASPKTYDELWELIKERVNKEGSECNLNDIDVSNIDDMRSLFSDMEFNGDISEWDTSNVVNMANMFIRCKNFNCDISNWDVSKVESMEYMFAFCDNFNQDISGWDVSKVKNMKAIMYFAESFNHDLSKWDVSSVKEHHVAFYNSGLSENKQPKFE